MTDHHDEFDAYTADFSTPRPENRENTIESTATSEEWRAFFGFDHFEVGTITADKAMEITAVASAVDFIADQFATLPCQVFKDTDKGPVKASDDPLYKLLHTVVNDQYMTSFEWRKAMCISLLLNGRAYSYVERDGRGREKNFRLIETDTVTPKIVNSRLVYEEKPKAGPTKLHDPINIIDLVRSPKMDGLSHYNPVKDNRSVLAMAIAVERFSTAVFQNNGIPPLQLVSQIEASVSAQERAGNAVFDALRRAASEKKNILPLPPGYELKKIGFDPAGMQLMELRKWLVIEVARIFKLPPVFLQDLSTGTYSNTEQQASTFVKNTLAPIVQSFEQQMSAKCGVRNTYLKLNFSALVRGDFKTQMEGLRSAVFAGIMTPNEARALLELPSKANGDELFMQGANQPLSALLNTDNQSVTPTDPVEPSGEE